MTRTTTIIVACLLVSRLAGAQALTAVQLQITSVDTAQKWTKDAPLIEAMCNQLAPAVGPIAPDLANPPVLVFDDRWNPSRSCLVPIDATLWASLPFGAYSANLNVTDAAGLTNLTFSPPVLFQKRAAQAKCPDGVPADWIMFRFETDTTWKKALICRPA